MNPYASVTLRRRPLDFGEEIGLPRPAAERVLRDVLAATEGIVAALEEDPLGLPPQQLRPWLRALGHRRAAALPPSA